MCGTRPSAARSSPSTSPTPPSSPRGARTRRACASTALGGPGTTARVRSSRSSQPSRSRAPPACSPSGTRGPCPRRSASGSRRRRRTLPRAGSCTWRCLAWECPSCSRWSTSSRTSSSAKSASTSRRTRSASASSSPWPASSSTISTPRPCCPWCLRATRAAPRRRGGRASSTRAPISASQASPATWRSPRATWRCTSSQTAGTCAAPPGPSSTTRRCA
mmetsp:Transcript_18549/g.58650  ORF Transcript_18549/g.58650 Transcript_18549/m.58650 type:complete len:219 (+) Transcript_18549:2569-3225(+)